MGNSPCVLALSADQQEYVAGDTLTGKVYLSVQNDQGYESSALHLAIKGREETCIQYQESYTETVDGRSETRQRTRYAYGHRKILDLEVILSHFNSGQVGAGQYEFPFSLDLPKGLPSSMSESSSGNYARITYKLEARLQRAGFMKFDKKYEHEFRLRTSPRLMSSTTGDIIRCPPDTQQVNFCCCFNRGSMTLGAELEKSVFTPGEQFKAGYKCKNDSTEEVRDVSVKLVQICRFYASGRSESITRTLAERTLHPSQVMGSASVSKEMTKHAHETYEALYNQEHQYVDLFVPSICHDSFQGGIISVVHNVEVCMSTGCCITNPMVEIPVYIQPRIGELVGIEQPIPIQGSVAGTITAEPIAVAEPVYGSSASGLAEAEVTLPANWNAQTSSIVAIPINQATIGGSVFSGSEQEPEHSTGYGAIDLYSGASAPLGGKEYAPTLAGLMAHLENTFDYTGVIEKYSTDPELQPVIEGLSSTDVSKILTNITFSLDQVRVAEKLAQGMRENFTMDHLICAFQASDTMNRVDIVKKLAPYTVDFDSRKAELYGRLDNFEQFQLTSVFS